MMEAFFQPSQRFHELELCTDASNFGWGGHVDTECLGEMASSPVELANQQTQGRGCGSLSQGVPPTPLMQGSPLFHGQLYSSILREQAGGGGEFDTSLSE